jgi:hypothetical protein
LANVAMLISILYLYIIGNADSKHEALICFALTGAWGLISIIYVLVSNVRKQRTVFGTAPRSAA